MEGNGPERIRTGTGQPDTTCQNLGCYHAASAHLNRPGRLPVKQICDSGVIRVIRVNPRGEEVPVRCIIFRMFGGRTSEQWIAQYASSHQHPVNRVCHTLGIPLILVSLVVFLGSIFLHRLWIYALALFLLGWIFQFIGHAFEHKEPEFFHDWRFLFVGVRWWWAKIQGKA